MEQRHLTVDDILETTRQLSPIEKAQLVSKVISDLEAALDSAGADSRPLQPVHGVCRDLGPAPSADEIDEARRELFESFPRVDIS